MPALVDRTGQRYGHLTVVERVEGATRTMWLCRCDCGTTAAIRADALVGGHTRTCGGHSRLEAPTYISAHIRVTRDRGRASDYNCRCGVPAEDWAYDHADPNELSEYDGRGAGRTRVYSADSWHYLPMCRACHRAFDREHKHGQ